jgi:MraZ protein
VAGFLGQYEYQLDQKGRVSLPAEYRRKVEDTRFVLLQWEPTHLTLFPDSTWEQVQERLLASRRQGRSAIARHLRRITARAVEVTPDKQGRILIPSWLIEAAGLEGSALLIGTLDRIEVWNPERFEAAAPDPGEETEELTDAVHEIFG